MTKFVIAWTLFRGAWTLFTRALTLFYQRSDTFSVKLALPKLSQKININYIGTNCPHKIFQKSERQRSDLPHNQGSSILFALRYSWNSLPV